MHLRAGMGLATYNHKRDFRRTSEPRGKTLRKGGFSFVVQKHAARSLHYDFRLELDGVLLSWAVPKGPSLDPSLKRLAMQTEDHPVEYGGFEGVIPEGEYGAGPVLVWDLGQWVPEGDPRKDYARGRLSFELRGEKLRGGFHLVRTKNAKGGKSWLLIKQNDAEARRGAPADIVDEAPKSALSGRTIEAIEADPDKIWHSNRSEKGRTNGGSKRTKVKAQTVAAPAPEQLAGARKARMPAFVEPQLATLVDSAPEGEQWLHELKLDGYRIQVRCDQGKVRALSRRGHDWTARVPSLFAELAALQIDRAIFDGELVVLEEGLSNFQRLQNSLREGRDRDCLYYAFDLLHLGDYDLRGVPLLQRKELLAATLTAAGAPTGGRIRYNDHVLGRGEDFFASACRLHAEGSIAKRADSTYVSGRTRSWLKIKCLARQEFVIGGFTEPSGSRSHFGALLLGVPARGGLQYAGKVGTGFSQGSLAELHQKLRPLEQSKAPFADPPRGAEFRDVHWVAPELVAEIEYVERTQDGRVRHASFRGLRDDKAARDVNDERAGKRARATAASGRRARPKRVQTTEASELEVSAAELPTPALRSVRLTHPERVLYPDQGLTKADLALYYAQVAARMLPHVANRVLALVRCPEGEGGECFFQKHPTRGLSSRIKRLPLREKKGGLLESMYVDDAEGLVELVQVGVLEIHTWGSHVDRVEQPDQLTFDLDPDEGLPWSRMVEGAKTLKAALEKLDLQPFLKATGGKGLHLVVPIEPRLEWDEIKAFCRAFSARIVEREPDKYLANISKAKRKGKILIDFLRNGRGATAVCAYSTRAKPRAPVAMPIAWSELTEALRPDQFRVDNVPARIAKTKDPWREFDDRRSRITPAVVREVAARAGGRAQGR